MINKLSMLIAATLPVLSPCAFAAGPDDALAAAAQATPQMRERAARLTEILKRKPEYRSSAFVYDRTLSVYESNPEKLAARCKMLGLSDIYYSFSDKAANDRKYHDRAVAFVALFHKYGLKVHALKYDNANCFASDEKVKSSAKTVTDFNQSVAAESRFDAVHADLEPHILKKGRSYVPKDLPYLWDNTNGFGPGKNNDKLMQQTLAILELARQEMKGLEISEALGTFFETRVDKGDLSYGSVNDFLKPCAYVTLMAYANKPEKICRMSEASIRKSKRPGSVAVCLKSSVGTLNDDPIETSLYPQGWDKLIEAAEYVTKKYEKSPAFRGLDFFEYAGLEKMWENNNK